MCGVCVCVCVYLLADTEFWDAMYHADTGRHGLKEVLCSGRAPTNATTQNLNGASTILNAGKCLPANNADFVSLRIVPALMISSYISIIGWSLGMTLAVDFTCLRLSEVVQCTHRLRKLEDQRNAAQRLPGYPPSLDLFNRSIRVPTITRPLQQKHRVLTMEALGCPPLLDLFNGSIRVPTIFNRSIRVSTIFNESIRVSTITHCSTSSKEPLGCPPLLDLLCILTKFWSMRITPHQANYNTLYPSTRSPSSSE